MSLQYTLRPIEAWPGVNTKFRKTSPFDSPWPHTLRDLEREYNALNGRDMVWQIAVTELDFKIDGGLRAHAKPSHPGVIITFDSSFVRDGERIVLPLRFACDRFFDWQANVRAIALGMEALRRVERYGISSGHEQYTGFKALPPGSGVEHGVKHRMSHFEAARFLHEASGGDGRWLPDHFMPHAGDTQLPRVREAYRAAVKLLHPDHGGTREQWDQLQEAAAVLGVA